MDISYNDSALQPKIRRPLLGIGSMTFGIATWIFQVAILVVYAVVVLTMPSTNPSAVQVLVLSVMSVLSFFSILLAIVRTIWIAADLGRFDEIPGYVRIMFIILSVLPLAFSILSEVVSILHLSFDIVSVEGFTSFSLAVNSMTFASNILLPAGIGAYMLIRSIKGGWRELVVAAIVVVHPLIRMFLVGRLTVGVYGIVINVVAVVVVAVASAIRISVLIDLAKPGWKTERKSAEAV